MSNRVNSPLLLGIEEVRKKGVPESLIGCYQQAFYRLSFGIRSWYPINGLKGHSYETYCLDLSHEDVNALLECKSKGFQDQKLSSVILRIDQIIDSFGNCGAFVKLDSRSPKDAPYDMDCEESVKEKVIKLMRDGIISRSNQLPKGSKWKWNSKETLDMFMNILYTTCMKVCTGEEAIRLLLKSQRVREDLASISKFYPYGLSTCICVRKWDSVLMDHSSLEFRAFVHNNQLTAISQYDYLIFSKVIKQHKETIKNLLTVFITQHVIPSLSTSHQSYIVDLFVHPDLNQVKIIELNSFESWTGACLFSWSNDRKVLLDGPFEFRIVEEPLDNQDDVNYELRIPSIWNRIMKKELHDIISQQDEQVSKNETNQESHNTSTNPNCIIS